MDVIVHTQVAVQCVRCMFGTAIETWIRQLGPAAAAAAADLHRVLVIQGCSSLTDAGLQALGQITSLADVSLQDCTDITGHLLLHANACSCKFC